MKIKEQIAVVTGGSSGMGKACVNRLLKKGARVVSLDLKKSDRDDSPHFRFIETDITNAEAAARAFETIRNEWQAPRICVHCAGMVYGNRLINTSSEDFLRVLTVNVLGTFHVLQETAKAMMTLSPLTSDGERGVIVTTSSIAAFEGQIGQTAYSASKAAVIGMTLPFARELASSGIRVITIAPGVVDTPMLQQLSEENRKALGQAVPFPKRLVHPDEFARLVLHGIGNAMLNGEVIRLDGALRMQAK